MKYIIIILFCVSIAQAQTTGNSLLLPDYLKIQYAGSIGMISTGPGYYLLKKKIQTELMFGFTPQSKYDDLYNLTLKINYKPFNYSFDEKISTSIIYFGVYISNTFGENFWIALPDNYPDNYYYASSGLRYGFYFGTSLIHTHGPGKKQGEFFFECGSYDLLLFSYWPNKNTIPLGDILKLAIGAKIDF